MYGNSSFMDSITASTNLSQKAMLMRQQCKDSLLDTRIATATAHFSDANNPETFYQQSIRSHLLHNIIHGTQLHVLSTAIIDYMWNKQAFIQLLILNELVKSPQERLEWIFWADRDTVILDYCRSPASFIAEEIRSNNETTDTTQGPDINLLITNDHNGLMAGVFIIRVCEWSVKFLSDVLAFRTFRPGVDLPYHEQTAMEILLKEDKYKENVAYIPQHWINNYRGDTAEDFVNRSDASDMAYWVARRGDFALHFAGSGNKSGNIMEYAGVGEEVFDAIHGGSILRNISMDIEEFWGTYKKT
ncbi:uncharacterized protein G6M90_00g068290 [Metarhizium brunneum]|uniref:Galactosyl transferase GMA12/MNN10 family protein n=1 Tax=Metarhizium brunneum TaxID=500148 RepID=A0A7D5UZ75_9HYPO|nr:hypothetical protein G6M90_00g068290 [Metarhizium brunneum]